MSIGTTATSLAVYRINVRPMLSDGRLQRRVTVDLRGTDLHNAVPVVASSNAKQRQERHPKVAEVCVVT